MDKISTAVFCPHKNEKTGMLRPQSDRECRFMYAPGRLFPSFAAVEEHRYGAGTAMGCDNGADIQDGNVVVCGGDFVAQGLAHGFGQVGTIGMADIAAAGICAAIFLLPD